MKKILCVCMFLLITTTIFANGNTQKLTVGYESENDREVHRYVRLTNLRTNIAEFGFKNIDNINENQIREISTELIDKYSKKMSKSIDNISFSRVIKNNGKWYVTLQENYLGIPILGSRIKYKINEKGDVKYFVAPSNLEIKTSSVATISEEKATIIAKQAFYKRYNLGNNSSLSSELEKLYYYPQYKDNEINVLLSYAIVVSTEEGHYKMKYYIDAHSGEILSDVNMIKNSTISGTITWQYYPKLYNVSATDFDIPISNVDVPVMVRPTMSYVGPTSSATTSGNYFLSWTGGPL